MAQRVTIQQAARDALAAWLSTELASEDISVEPRWMEPDQKLAPKQITIIDAGPREIEWLQPEVLASTALEVDDEPRVDATWALGYVEQPVQLDVWARSDVELDDIIARLDESLNKGSAGLGVTDIAPVIAGLQLQLAGDWAPGVVDVAFDAPSIMQAASSVGEGEWRAMYRGRACVQLVQTARSPRLARVLLEARLYERDGDSQSEPETTVIVPEVG